MSRVSGPSFIAYDLKTPFSHVVIRFIFIGQYFWCAFPISRAILENEPAHDKTYDVTCATSEDSDKSDHPRSLIRVFANRMCLLQPPGCPNKINENSCHTCSKRCATCATSEDSDQPAHTCSLIRVFADRMCFLQPPGYPNKINENSCHTGWMYRLI